MDCVCMLAGKRMFSRVLDVGSLWRWECHAFEQFQAKRPMEQQQTLNDGSTNSFIEPVGYLLSKPAYRFPKLLYGRRPDDDVDTPVASCGFPDPADVTAVDPLSFPFSTNAIIASTFSKSNGISSSSFEFLSQNDKALVQCMVPGCGCWSVSLAVAIPPNPESGGL